MLKADGDLVRTRIQTREELSITSTAGRPVTQVTMQADGDLVASGATGIQWRSETSGNPGAFAVLQNNGKFMIYNSGGARLRDYANVINWDTPTIGYRDGNDYAYVETSELWRQRCEQLPCFDALRWPGYDSIHIETKINGQPAVIQLWQSWCQKFLGLQDFPGGVGAEVGLYRREPRRLRPTSLPFLPPEMERNVLQALKVLPDRDIWWPAPD